MFIPTLLCQVSLPDFAVWMTTFCGFLFFSIDIGLAMGVGLSQLILFAQSSAVLCSQIGWEVVGNELLFRPVENVDLLEEQLTEASGMILSTS